MKSSTHSLIENFGQVQNLKCVICEDSLNLAVYTHTKLTKLINFISGRRGQHRCSFVITSWSLDGLHRQPQRCPLPQVSQARQTLHLIWSSARSHAGLLTSTC